jgi:hypothetical protein
MANKVARYFVVIGVDIADTGSGTPGLSVWLSEKQSRLKPEDRHREAVKQAIHDMADDDLFEKNAFVGDLPGQCLGLEVRVFSLDDPSDQGRYTVVPDITPFTETE